MAASTDLTIARKNLQENLGENMKLYLQNLKSWFKQKISKEDFDVEARKILPEKSVHLHNDFLLAIITRCQTLSPSLVPRDSSISGKTRELGKHTKASQLNRYKRRSLSSRGTIQHKFAAVNPVLKAPDAHPELRGAQDIAIASRELTLPDITMVHGRMLVCAWECDLEEVTDAAVKLVMQSVENHLKNIFSLVLSRRSGYKVREKKFCFSMGSQVKNPYLRHSNMVYDIMSESEATTISSSGSHVPSRKPPVDIGEEMAIQHLATADEPVSKGPVTMFDLLDTLQLYRSSIASHSVYAPAVERVIHKLWHPSHEDLNQELIHKQEVLIKQQGGSHR